MKSISLLEKSSFTISIQMLSRSLSRKKHGSCALPCARGKLCGA